MAMLRTLTTNAACLGACLLVMAAAAPAPTPAKLVRFWTEARVDVDPEGKVVGVETEATLPAGVAATIRDRVGQWRFKPPQKDGRSVGGVTFVRINACAAPENGQYRMAVAYAGNGPGRVSEVRPHYPEGAVRAGKSARMQVTYRVSGDGKATIDDIVFTGGNAGKKWERDFRRAVTDWLGAMRFRNELLDGVPVETKVKMPVNFETGDTQKFSSLQAAQTHYSQLAQEQAAREATCQAAMAVPASEDDRQVTLDSPFQWQPAG